MFVDSKESLVTKKLRLNSHQKSDAIYSNKAASIALIVKPTATIDQRNPRANDDSDEDYERTKPVSNQVFVRHLRRIFVCLFHSSLDQISSDGDSTISHDNRHHTGFIEKIDD